MDKMAVFALLAAEAMLFLASAQEAPLATTETRAVEIDVVVKDKSGNPIPGLRREDFAVSDDGRPRDIRLFSAADSGGAPEKPASGLTAIVLDGLNTEFTDEVHAREQALEAVRRLPPDESIGVLALTPGMQLQNFTRNRDAVLRAITAFQPAIPPYSMRRRIQVTLAALKTLAGRMGGASGRKSIIWITGAFPRIHAYDRAIQQSLNAIDDRNVALYPIDARGLTLGGAALGIQTLEWFADSTGGQAYFNRNDLAAAIAEAVDDSRSAYVLGFYLADRERDRRFHELKVAVARPGAVVRHRRGYSPRGVSEP